jgi:integrase/recombinase XerD
MCPSCRHPYSQSPRSFDRGLDSSRASRVCSPLEDAKYHGKLDTILYDLILCQSPHTLRAPRRDQAPAPAPEEVQKLLESIDVSHLVALRDRALLAVMAYTFARIGAIISLTPEDYFQTGNRSLIRFREKGGKEKEIPIHHKLEEYLDAYLDATKLLNRPKEPIFRSTRGRSRELGSDGLSRKDAWAMLKRRLRNAGLSTIYSNYSFRATGITNYLENGGTLEVAQRIAGHADSQTTKFYDRRGQKVLLEDMERIRY